MTIFFYFEGLDNKHNQMTLANLNTDFLEIC